MWTEITNKQQQVYLLRLWQEQGEWRIRVSDLQQGEEYFFTSLAQLTALLGHDCALPPIGHAATYNVGGYG